MSEQLSRLVEECKLRGLYWAGGPWCDWVTELDAQARKAEARVEELERENAAWQNQNLLEQCNRQADRIEELEAEIESLGELLDAVSQALQGDKMAGVVGVANSRMKQFEQQATEIERLKAELPR